MPTNSWKYEAESHKTFVSGFKIVSFNIVPVGSNAARHLLDIIVACEESVLNLFSASLSSAETSPAIRFAS